MDAYGKGELPRDISSFPHILIEHNGENISLILDSFHCSGAEWGESFFWISEDRTSWDLVLDDNQDCDDPLKATLAIFSLWRIEKNQQRIRQGGVREDGMLISASVPLSVLEKLYLTRTELGDIEERINGLHVALRHLQQLKWAYIRLREWKFDSAILLVNPSEHDTFTEIISQLTSAGKPIFTIA